MMARRGDSPDKYVYYKEVFFHCFGFHSSSSSSCYVGGYRIRIHGEAKQSAYKLEATKLPGPYMYTIPWYTQPCTVIRCFHYTTFRYSTSLGAGTCISGFGFDFRYDYDYN